MLFFPLFFLASLTTGNYLCYAQSQFTSMPKKTKKEKIIAEYRRKMLASSFVDRAVATLEKTTLSQNNNPKDTFSYALSQKAASEKIEKREGKILTLDPQEFTAIKKDLLWTLILTTIILIGELSLWRIVG